MIKKKLPLVWDDWNRNHIKKHNVTIAEAQEAYQNIFRQERSYDNRMLYFGKTSEGRVLGIAVSFKKQKGPYVVSVRDMSKKERMLYL